MIKLFNQIYLFLSNINIKYFLVLFIAICFSIAYFLSPIFETTNFIPINWFRLPYGFVLYIFLLTILVFAIKYYHQIDNTKCNNKDYKISNKFLFIISFIIFFLLGIFYLLIYYPGTGMYDTIAIIGNENSLGYAKQHPWFYIIFIHFIVKIAKFFGGNYETALVLESLFQIFCYSLLCSYLLVWLNKKNIKLIPLLLVFSIYAFSPILNLYKIALFKDILFSIVLIAWTPILYDFVETDGKILYSKKNFIFISILILLSLLRNNGFYVTAFILLVLFIFCLFKKIKVFKQIIYLSLIFLSVILFNICFEKINKIDHLFKETVGIPLQQIARTVVENGNIAEYEMDFINIVIPIDFIKSKYDPYTVDTLKWRGSPINNKFLNKNKIKFLKIWFDILLKNPKIYLKAYLYNTYGFWSITNNRQIRDRYNTIYVKALENFFVENNIHIKSIFSMKVQTILENITYEATNDSLNEGLVFWSFILLISVLIIIKDTKYLIIASPIFGGWLTLMVATPVAFQYRYILFISLSLPLFIGIILLPFIGKKNDNQNSQNLAH